MKHALFAGAVTVALWFAVNAFAQRVDSYDQSGVQCTNARIHRRALSDGGAIHVFEAYGYNQTGDGGGRMALEESAHIAPGTAAHTALNNLMAGPCRRVLIGADPKLGDGGAP